MLKGIFLRGHLLLEAAAANYVWTENLMQVAIAALLSMVPTFEGRYAIVAMLGMGMPAGFAYILAVVFSSLPMPIILLLLRPVLDWFYTLPIKPVRAFAAWLEKRSEKKRAKMHANQGTGIRGWLSKHLSQETIELIGLYIFVALPLPGTGCWTGSAVATLFEMPRLKSAIVITLGNITACAIMLAASLGVISIF
jgi:uncharacterized membrane protein